MQTQTQTQSPKQKATTKEKVLLWTGIILCILAFVVFFSLFVIPSIFAGQKGTWSSSMGIGMLGVAMTFFFSLPAFITGLCLIIASLLSGKKDSK